VVDFLIHLVDPLGGIQTEAAEEALARRRAGLVYDIGVRLATTNDAIHIADVREDSPAHRAGLKEGDTLLKIDETPIDTLGLFRAHHLLRSTENKPLVLTIKTTEDVLSTQRLERAETELPDIEFSEALPFQLAYLQVNRLRPGTGASIAEIISRWADQERYGVLLDLRGADGDDLASVKTVAELFAQPETLLFAYRDKDDQDLHVEYAGPFGPLSLPVMVLVDAQTGGAAEVLAAVLSDSVHGAMLFGQPTRGDMLVRDTVSLPDGSRLYLATRRLMMSDGTTYVGMTGVRPDVFVARVDEDTSMYRPVRSARTEVLDEEIEQEKLYHRVRGDAALRRAVDVLLGLKALDIRPRGSSPHHTR